MAKGIMGLGIIQQVNQMLTAMVHTDKRGRRSKHFPQISIAKLALEVGISHWYAGAILSGKRTGRFEVLRRMAGALGVTMEELGERIREVREAQGL